MSSGLVECCCLIDGAARRLDTAVKAVSESAVVPLVVREVRDLNTVPSGAPQGCSEPTEGCLKRPLSKALEDMEGTAVDTSILIGGCSKCNEV